MMPRIVAIFLRFSGGSPRASPFFENRFSALLLNPRIAIIDPIPFGYVSQADTVRRLCRACGAAVESGE